MKNETQIRTFISETVAYINADTLADFQQQLWHNYESNNAEYHPDFQQDFDRIDFDLIASEFFTVEENEAIELTIEQEAEIVMSAIKSIPMTFCVFDGKFVEGTWRGKTSASFKYDVKNRRVIFDKAGYLNAALENVNF